MSEVNNSIIDFFKNNSSKTTPKDFVNLKDEDDREEAVEVFPRPESDPFDMFAYDLVYEDNYFIDEVGLIRQFKKHKNCWVVVSKNVLDSDLIFRFKKKFPEFGKPGTVINASQINYIKGAVKSFSTLKYGETWVEGVKLFKESVKFIPFKNVILNVEKENRFELAEHHPDFRFSKILQVDYQPSSGADCPVFKELINSLAEGDEDIKTFLKAFCFMSFFGRCDSEVSILNLFSVEGGSGKSTFINLLGDILGERCKYTTLASLKDSTSVLELKGCSLVLFPDERGAVGKNGKEMEMVLKLTGGDGISLRRVYADKTEKFTLDGLMIFASNKRMFPLDSALSRRLVNINTKAVPRELRDYNISIKLKQEIPTIVNYLLEDMDISKAKYILKEAPRKKSIRRHNLQAMEDSSVVALFLNIYVKTVPVTKEEIYRTKDDWKKLFPETYIEIFRNPPCVMVKFLYKYYKVFLKEENEGTMPVSKQRFVIEVKQYCKEKYDKEVIVVDSQRIYGAGRIVQRFVGITLEDRFFEDYPDRMYFDHPCNPIVRMANS